MKIGIFDSGFGGLDIMKGIVRKFPDYDYVYLGDTARTPYGNRSQEVIYEYTKSAVEFLFNNDCKLIILACNTASAEALPKIQQEYLTKNFPDRRVLGVIIPACEKAASVCKNNRLAVLATESSVNSNAFVREVEKLNPDMKIFQQAAPLLVPLVETWEKDEEILLPIVRKYIKPIVDRGPDSLILGCTHYGVLEKTIKKVIEEFGSEISIINESDVVAEKLAEYLKRHPEIEQNISKNKKTEFFSTDLTDRFQKIGSLLMEENISVKKANLG